MDHHGTPFAGAAGRHGARRLVTDRHPAPVAARGLGGNVSRPLYQPRVGGAAPQPRHVPHAPPRLGPRRVLQLHQPAHDWWLAGRLW